MATENDNPDWGNDDDESFDALDHLEGLNGYEVGEDQARLDGIEIPVDPEVAQALYEQQLQRLAEAGF